MAPESTWGLEINVTDDRELDPDALEEMIENTGEEVGERAEALAEWLNERWGVYKRLVEASPNPHKQSILVPLCPNALILVENFFEELKAKVGR